MKPKTRKRFFEKEDILKILREKGIELKRTPRASDFYKKGKPSRFNNSVGSIFGSFGKAIQSIDFDIVKIPVADYIKVKRQEIIDRFREFAEKIGHIPTAREVKEGFFVSVYHITKRFRCSFRGFIEITKLDSAKFKPKKRQGRGVAYSDEQLLKQYRKLALNLGRIPHRNDFRKSKSICSWSTFMKRFKTEACLIEKAGKDVLSLPRSCMYQGKIVLIDQDLRGQISSFIKTEFISKGKIPARKDLLEKSDKKFPKSRYDIGIRACHFREVVEKALTMYIEEIRESKTRFD